MDQKQSDRREQIIDAAYAVLAEQGYEAASIKEIAKAAGVAAGLIHYYFPKKDDLLVAVLRRASDRYTEAMQQAGVGAVPGDLIKLGLAEPQRRIEEQPELYRLRYDLFALGLRNPSIRPAVASLLANARQGIAAVATRALGKEAPNVDALAAVLLACFDGLALQQLAEPDFDLAAAFDVLGLMVASLHRVE